MLFNFFLRVNFKRLFFAILPFLFISCDTDPEYSLANLKYKLDDNIIYSQKEIQDADWKSFRGDTGGSIFWMRMKFDIEKTPDPLEPLGININCFGAYEAYWDGKLIGQNGRPGFESQDGKTSRVDQSFIIPIELSDAGEHVLALRTSQHFDSAHQRGVSAKVSNHYSLIRKPLIQTLFMHILAGVFLIAAIYYFIFYLNQKGAYPPLLFSVTSFLFFILIILEYIKFYVPIHYSSFYTRLEIISLLVLAISFLITLYFSLQFSSFNKKIIFTFYGIFLISIYLFYFGQYDYMAEKLGVLAWIASVIVVGRSVLRKTLGALVVFIGLFVSMFINYFFIYDVSLFISFTVISLCMLYILSLKITEQRKAYELSIIQSTRLKHELLKKKIQPHFLMNTLTSLIDWVEESPAEGILFIESLAREFDILNKIEDQTLIPISQEIELCTSHLDIMRYRKEINYIWKHKGIDFSQNIPPAIIHTLLENGITHCLPLSDSSIKFELSYDLYDDAHIYTFITYGKIRAPQKPIVDGTGFKYIKSRLKESYNLNWKFTSEILSDGWKNTIVIFK